MSGSAAADTPQISNPAHVASTAAPDLRIFMVVDPSS